MSKNWLQKKEEKRRKRQEKRKNAFNELISLERKIEIKKNNHISEADIQARLWKKFIDVGIDAKLEYRFDIILCGQKIQNRFDIIIFSDKKPVVIEVKRGDKKAGEKQKKKYESLDCELFYCFGENNISEVFGKVMYFLKKI